MKPASFKYYAPTTLDEVLSLLAEYSYDAKVLAGGQSLIPTMNFRLAQPSVLIDINRIGELAFVEMQKKSLHIGAMTRQCELECNELVATNAPLVKETMAYVAHPQIRNRGTIGGIIAHADPAAELPAVMIATEASFRIRGKNEDRWVAADKFFVGMFATDLKPEEILVEIKLPRLPKRSGWSFHEITRRHGDYALVGAAAVVTLNRKQNCEQARIVLISVGDGPVQAKTANRLLVGQTLSPDIIKQAAKTAAHEDIDPGSDIHASAQYRRYLVENLVEKVLKQAILRAQG